MVQETDPAKAPDTPSADLPAAREKRPVSLGWALFEHALFYGLICPPIAGFLVLVGMSGMVALSAGFQLALSGFVEFASILFIGSYYAGIVPAILIGVLAVPISRTIDKEPRLYAVMGLTGWAISSCAVYLMISHDPAAVFMVSGAGAIAVLVCTRLARNLRARWTPTRTI